MLSYDLSITGVRNVKTALRSIETEMLRHNARVTRSMGVTTSSRRTSPENEAARIQKAQQAADAKAAAAKQRQIAREEAAEVRAAQRVAAQKARLEQQLHRQKLADAKREAVEKTREEKKALAKQERTRFALARRRLAKFKAETLRGNRLAMASRSAMLGGAYQGAVAPLASVGRTAKMMVGLGGAAVVGSSVAKQFATERSATMLANKAFGTPGETRDREQIKQSLMAQSEAIGSITGDRAGVIEAMDKFVAISGSLPGAQQLGQFMADISDATGAQMGDVGRTGGQVLQNLMSSRNIDPSDTKAMNEALKDTREIMAAMAGQAKIGSIEFSDLAQNMGSVMSATTRFRGNVADLANEMGAIAQLSIAGGASSPEEAMTALKRFSDDIVRNSERFEKMTKGMGIESFFTDKSKTQLRGPTEIITDVMRATKGDLTKVQKIFNIRSMKAFEPFQKAVMEEQKGGKSFEEALSTVQEKIGRFTSSKMTQEEVKTSASFTREQTGRKFAIVWEDLQTKVGKELAPAIDDLIPAFTELASLLKDAAPYLSAFLKALVKNPLMIGGSLVAGRMGIGALAGGVGGGLSTVGMGGGMGGGGLASLFGAAGAPVRVVNFPPGLSTLNGQIVGQSIGGVLVAAGIGAAIGAPIAAAITVWGQTEVQRREAKTSEIVKDATLGDAKKAMRAANEALKEAQTKKKRNEELSTTFIQGMLGGSAYGPMPGKVNLDPLSEQQQFDINNLEGAKKTAEARLAQEEFDREFVKRAKEGVTALDGFYKKLNAFEPPKVNRGDTPSEGSPVKAP